MPADDAARAAVLRTIAARELGVETLESRRSDSLDFHEISVWTLEAALVAAYEAGRGAARRERPPTTVGCPACGREIRITPVT